MPKVTFLPSGKTIEAPAGKSLLDLAFENDIIIEHNCGGLCACTSCRTVIIEGSEFLTEKNDEEKRLLDESGFSERNNRLSCCCIIKDSFNEQEIIAEIPQP
jgi:2Fe-2S ferredoxin